jgi:ABC-type antimicrobial peptide transport system permease subunit
MDLTKPELTAIWIICGLILFALGFICGVIFGIRER